MKYLVLLILIFGLNDSYAQKKINSNLIGIYEYETSKKNENHYIVIQIIEGKLNGLYFGTEDSGDHGVFFYGNKMENLNLANKKITFEIKERELYETTLFQFVKPGEEKENQKSIGISKRSLKYSGKITDKGFEIICQSEFGDCWGNKLFFKKLPE